MQAVFAPWECLIQRKAYTNLYNPYITGGFVMGPAVLHIVIFRGFIGFSCIYGMHLLVLRRLHNKF